MRCHRTGRDRHRHSIPTPAPQMHWMRGKPKTKDRTTRKKQKGTRVVRYQRKPVLCMTCQGCATTLPRVCVPGTNSKPNRTWTCYYVVQYEHDYTYVRNRCSKETDQADSTYHAQLLLHVYFVYVIRWNERQQQHLHLNFAQCWHKHKEYGVHQHCWPKSNVRCYVYTRT